MRRPAAVPGVPGAIARPAPAAALAARCTIAAIGALAVVAAMAAGVAAATRAPAARSRAAAGRPAAHAAARPATAPELSAAALATQAAGEENLGAYGLAVERLRALRGRVPADGDLEMALALDEARAGQVDSALVRLNGPLLSAMLADSSARSRRHEYDPEHAAAWLDGRTGGWSWYVARARAELALALGRPAEALAAARLAALARPLSGPDQLLLALAAFHARDPATSREAARRAAALDPLLPEAHYACGEWAWMDGDRARAREEFEAAIGRDSTFRRAAVALARLTLPGTRPDTLPSAFLTGDRRVVALTAPAGPKPEENPHNDQPAGIYGQPTMTLADSLQAVMKLERPLHFYVTVLVSAGGAAVVSDLPWIGDGQMPDAFIGAVNAEAGRWRFKPAMKLGRPVRSWATVELIVNP